MGKRKSRSGNSSKNNQRNKLFAAILLSLVLIGGGIYLAVPSAPSVPVAPATGDLVETNPVLSTALFTGNIAQAYRIAAEIPKVIDSQFCYCYCKKEKGHKTLLTCFTNRHGSKCETCLAQVFYAYDLYNQGKTLDEIVIAMDKKFYRPYQPHKI